MRREGGREKKNEREGEKDGREEKEVRREGERREVEKGSLKTEAGSCMREENS